MSLAPRFPRPARPLALCLALAACGATLAQEALPDIHTLVAQAEMDGLIDLRQRFEFDGGEVSPSRVVKGAPYCADAVHENVQWLPDGAGGAPNRIVRQQTTRLCRDGEGRTRQEVERGGRKLVYLRDPVARESWVLDPERKTARRLGGPRDPGSDPTAWREYGERMREFARSVAERARSGATAPTPPTPPTPPMPALPPLPVIIETPDAASAPGRRQTEVRVMRMGRDGEAAVEWAMPPMAVQWRAQSLAPRGAGSVTPLAPKDIEGVRANGERTSWVIEAGQVGNEKPIQIVREVWTSPELMVTVMSRDFDPRSGESLYRLKGLKRAEPDPALMRVPTDFAKPVRPPAHPSPRASGPTG